MCFSYIAMLKVSIVFQFTLFSHEIIIGFLFSLEATLITIVTVIFITHDIWNHCGIVIQFVAFTTTSFNSWSLLLSLSLLFFLFELLIVDCLQAVSNLLNLLRVTWCWKVFCEFFEKVLNSVRSFSCIKGLSYLFAKLFVIFLGVQGNVCVNRGTCFIAKKLISNSSLSCFLKSFGFLCLSHTFQFFCCWSLSRGSTRKLFLSLFKCFVIINLVWLVLYSRILFFLLLLLFELLFFFCC